MGAHALVCKHNQTADKTTPQVNETAYRQKTTLPERVRVRMVLRAKDIWALCFGGERARRLLWSTGARE